LRQVQSGVFNTPPYQDVFLQMFSQTFLHLQVTP
jgi:hypothetical protein